MRIPRRFPFLVSLFSLLAGPASAQRSLRITDFTAAVAVNRDASIDVTEAITAEFTGSWNGIYRTVPVDYRTPQGFNWTLRLSDQVASDLAGNPLKLEVSRERHYIKHKIWVSGARDASKSIAFHYKARNGLRYFEDHDELYWNVTGDEWDVPIEAASAVITLPAGATGVRATAFNGPYGATSKDAEVVVQGTTVQVRMPKPLAFREGLTVVVGWDKGLVDQPSGADKAMGFLASNWPLALPIPVFACMLWLWSVRGRDPRRRPITVQYEPPENLTPAEAGALVDYRADMRDITATLVDLAVRGYIRIEEVEDPVLFGLFNRDDFAFHLLKPRAEWGGLATHERLVLQGVFEDGDDIVRLSDLKNQFYRHLGGIKRSITGELIEKGLYRSDPTKTRSSWIILALITGFVTIVTGSIIGARFSLTPVPFVVAGIVIALIIGIFGYHMPARTIPGARAQEQLLGFSEFMERVDKEKYRHIIRTPEMFEKFLPFAMAFGVENRWAKAFQHIYTQPPTWYGGSNFSSFDAGRFSSRLSSMSTRVGETMTSQPRSSSGSRFSGGGSSGGGGGGGGGGGF